MNVGNMVGIALGIKLVNGKIRPKFKKKITFGLIIIGFLMIAFLCGIVYGLMTSDYEIVGIGILGILSFGYIILISPYTQKSDNYYIEFQDENTLSSFILLSIDLIYE